MNSRRQQITLQPELLRWARERAGLTQDDLAKKIPVNPDRVRAWEQTGKISIAQIDKLAAKTYTPLGYLYLPEPPDESLPIRDFRTRSGDAPTRPSPDLLETVYQMQRRQNWMRDDLIEGGADPLNFVGAYSLTDSHTEVAAAMRARWASHWMGRGQIHLERRPPVPAQQIGQGRRTGRFQRRRRKQQLSQTRPD